MPIPTYKELIHKLEQVCLTNLIREDLTDKQRAIYCIKDNKPDPKKLVKEYEFWNTFILEFDSAEACDEVINFKNNVIDIISKISSTRILIKIGNNICNLYFKPDINIITMKNINKKKLKWYYIIDKFQETIIANNVHQLYLLKGCVLVLAVVEFIPTLKTMHVAYYQ